MKKAIIRSPSRVKRRPGERHRQNEGLARRKMLSLHRIWKRNPHVVVGEVVRSGGRESCSEVGKRVAPQSHREHREGRQKESCIGCVLLGDSSRTLRIHPPPTIFHIPLPSSTFPYHLPHSPTAVFHIPLPSSAFRSLTSVLLILFQFCGIPPGNPQAEFAQPTRLHPSFQKSPEITPSSSISIFIAAGSFGRPGMVMVLPV